MSFLTQAKEKAKREIEAYKYNKKLENNPEVVRQRLETARKEQKEQLQLEKDKAELRKIKGDGKVIGAIKSAGQYLDGVKQKQGKGSMGNNARQNATLGTGRNIIYDKSPLNSGALGFGENPKGSKSLIMSDVKGNNTSVFGHSGGVVGQQPVAKPKKTKSNKVIVIKL